MESLAALGLASNILTFVDFAWTLATEVRDICKADTADSANTRFLSVVVLDINRLNDSLSQCKTQSKDLQKLLTESQAIATELIKALEILKADKAHSKWSSFLVAVKQVWGNDKVETWFRRLGILQQQISRHMQNNILAEISDLNQVITNLETSIRSLEIQRKYDLQSLRKDMLLAVRSLREPGRHETRMQQYFQRPPESRSDQLYVTQISDQMRTLLSALTQFETATLNAELDRNFLKALHFSNMKARHSKIDPAHARTFDWVFENTLPGPLEQPINFKEWLCTQNGVFWIQGKAGSGKSTLMKFLSRHEKTLDFLRAWSGSKKLIIADFFFWNAGTELQKSQEGLLRSLLFEILRQCPELISQLKPLVKFPSEYEQHGGGWQLEDLLHMYRTIVSLDVPVKFCLFIDGLDEFSEEQRTHGDLLKMLRDLEYSTDIKLCVSSRPWTVFRDEFENNSKWLLKLEDLTRGDIVSYVKDKFNEHGQFSILKKRDEGYSSLVEQVVDKAQGVFLWVVLVVRDLLEGLTYHDSVATLMDRLAQFPPDLEDFFRHLIDSIPAIYKKQTARSFTVASTFGSAVPMMLFSFLDDIENNPAFSMNLPLGTLSDKEIDDRKDQMRRRLDGRTKGLLEVTQLKNAVDQRPFMSLSVDFLHRTVSDFLKLPEIQTYLQQLPQSDKTPLTTCHSVLAVMKTAPFENVSDIEFMETLIGILFIFLSIVPTDSPHMSASEQVVSAAEEVYSSIAPKFAWSKTNVTFIGQACKVDLFWYVQKKLQYKTEDGKKARVFEYNDFYKASQFNRPFLDYAVFPSGHKFSLRIIELLLENGADPNEVFNNESVFVRFLKELRRVPFEKDRDIIIQITKTLLQYGAGIDSRKHTTLDKRRKSVQSLIRDVFTPDIVAELLGSIPEVQKEDPISPKAQQIDMDAPDTQSGSTHNQSPLGTSVKDTLPEKKRKLRWRWFRRSKA